MNAVAGSDIRTPAWVHDDRWAWVIKNFSELSIVTEDYFESGRIAKLKILSFDLNFFRVVDFRRLGWAGVLGWRLGYSGRYLRLNIEVDRVCVMDEETAKNYIIDFLSEHPEIYNSGESICEVASRIKSAKGVDELFSVL